MQLTTSCKKKCVDPPNGGNNTTAADFHVNQFPGLYSSVYTTPIDIVEDSVRLGLRVAIFSKDAIDGLDIKISVRYNAGGGPASEKTVVFTTAQFTKIGEKWVTTAQGYGDYRVLDFVTEPLRSNFNLLAGAPLFQMTSELSYTIKGQVHTLPAYTRSPWDGDTFWNESKWW